MPHFNMSESKVYLAVDLGASSGRVLAGVYDGSRIDLRELNRFENTPVALPDGWHWNITSLYNSILEGLKTAYDEFGDQPVSVGIDTWGVDYALIDSGGRLLGLPYQYRDNRKDGMMEVAFEKVSKRAIYDKTGIQFMLINSVYQLLADVDKGNPALSGAEDLMFIPDLLSYWLCGVKVQERTFASTSQLYNPNTEDWDRDLIAALGLPDHIFKSISDPGKALGALRPEVASRTGFEDLNVVLVAGHDTASAVAAVPSQASIPAYLSSGTWSLMGLELSEPVINDETFEDSFTNEIGIGNTVRFLRNICGLWLIQESRRYWQESGRDYRYGEIATLAKTAKPFRSLIDPDDARFAQPGLMPEKIAEYCRETGQPTPDEPAQVMRCIYESLALTYRIIWDKLLKYAPSPPDALHVVGGGSQDKLLNQFTANALEVTVQAGPTEATGLGNILCQMMADKEISSLAEGRKIVAQSFPCETFEPEDGEVWREASSRYARLLEN